jgi:Skp family chaperone for outer membrane proteins
MARGNTVREMLALRQHSSWEIIMLNHRLLCVSAILTLLTIPATAQDQNVKPYSSGEIDSMLATLRSNVAIEIDAKINAVNSSLAELNKKLDAYRSSLIIDTNKKLDGLKSDLQTSQKAIDGKLSAITTDTDNKVNDLGQREEAEIKALDGRIPTAPWWSAALLGALFGAAASFAFNRYSVPRSAQRRTDPAGSPS